MQSLADGMGLPLTFSSPIVNLPVVTLLFSAYDCSFPTASLGSTDWPNLTLALVYSCPFYKCNASVSHQSQEDESRTALLRLLT